jgi:subtilisin family serine protease
VVAVPSELDQGVRILKKVLLPALALASLLLATTAAAVPAPTVAGGSDRERVLVGFDRAPAASDRAAVAQLGAVVRRELSDADALAVDISSANVGALARLGGVSYVEPDELRYPLGLADAQLVPSLSNGLYGLLTTKATTAQSRGVIGTGIKACVADTGLDYTHPDIAPNYKGGIDTVANDNDPWYHNTGLEDETHGTHVAGTILAADNSVGVFGVAYGASLYQARVLTNAGGYSSDIMDGVRWLVETAGCKVVNMSLGGGGKSRTEEAFYKSMRSKGALIVAAAGNDGRRTVSYPAAYPANIAVGAVDRTNAHASFSNSGKNLDVSAPGVGVLSSVPAGHGTEASVVSGASSVTAFGLEFAGTTSGTTGTLVDCGLAQAASNCGGAPAGFVALIQRGTNTFADKVTNATAAGAAAAVIYNNVAGDFTGTLGAAGSWIPAVSTSDTNGTILKGQVGQSATVVNQASSWDTYDGTSMATPHVTGVVALIWSANPGLSNSTVESYLFSSATDLGAAGYDTTYGYGLVNADAAVALAGG